MSVKQILDIEDSRLRTTVAKLTVQYWEELAVAAARVHPGWQVTEDGQAKWLGGKTGPRVPRTLRNWFSENYRRMCPRT